VLELKRRRPPPEEAIGRAEVQAFKSWLIQEARAWGKRSK